MQPSLFNDVLTWMDKVEEAENKIYEMWKKHNGKLALAFSGGKDSSVLLHIIRKVESKYGIKILVVASDTGQELPGVKKNMYDNADIVLKPKLTFGECGLKYGFPFKNKDTDKFLDFVFGKTEEQLATSKWNINKSKTSFMPKESYMQYAKTNKVSAKCCDVLKKQPMKEFISTGDVEVLMLGVRIAEGGARSENLRKGCIWKKGNIINFAPMVNFSNEDMEDIIKHFDIKLPFEYELLKQYASKSNQRTGCVFCPYGKFRKDKSWYFGFLEALDKHYNTNYLKAFKVINRKRIELDGIEQKGDTNVRKR